MTKLLAQDGGVDLQFLRDVGGEFVAHDAAGNALDVGQQIVDGFDLAFGSARELCLGTLDEVGEILLRSLQDRPIGSGSLAAHEEVGIEALLKGDDADLEVLADEQGERALGGGGSGGVWIEIYDNLFAEAGEQARLGLGEGGAAGGDDVVISGVEYGDAVHLPLDEDDVVEAADRLFGEVEIEEHARLAVDGRLGRVEVLGAGFVIGGKGASGEGDDFAALIADGEDDAVAELAVERGGRGLGVSRVRGNGRRSGCGRLVALLPTEEAAFAERILVGHGFEFVAKEEAGLGGEADAEARNGLVVEAAAAKILTGGGGFGTAELLLKPLAGGLVKIEQKAAGAGLARFLRRVELGLGRGDAELLGDGANGLRKGDVLDFLDEGEDVSGDSAAEAVEELAAGVDGKRRRFFAVEGTKTGVVLGPGFAQLYIFADDADDVGLLLDGVSEVSGVSHRTSLHDCGAGRNGLLCIFVEKLCVREIWPCSRCGKCGHH